MVLTTIVIFAFVISYIFFHDNPVVQVDPKFSFWVHLANGILTTLLVILLIKYYVDAAINSENKLEEANREITYKNEQIIQSISYAQRIQSAVMPDEYSLQEYFDDHFLFYIPKDIVSGDFFWVKEKGDYVLFTAADCTGHGVPGAFMSMLGITMLNEISSGNRFENSADILDRLRDKVKEALDQNKNADTKDGMDMSLGMFHKKSRTLYWSGANNPLFLVRRGELKEYKADKQPIGQHMMEKPFTNHEITLQNGDQLYMFSDGFPDQYGGPRNKKFMRKNFKNLLLKNSGKNMNQQKSLLNQAFLNWKKEGEQIDDVIVLGLRV